MKKSGLTLIEHYELGRNLRQLKEQARSIHLLLSSKFGKSKGYAKQADRIGKCVDSMTDDLDKIVSNMSDAPPDVCNYYYKI